MRYASNVLNNVVLEYHRPHCLPWVILVRKYCWTIKQTILSSVIIILLISDVLYHYWYNHVNYLSVKSRCTGRNLPFICTYTKWNACIKVWMCYLVESDTFHIYWNSFGTFLCAICVQNIHMQHALAILGKTICQLNLTIVSGSRSLPFICNTSPIIVCVCVCV